MIKFDCTCFVGSWPFYELKNQSLNDLRALHESRGVCGGLVSSLNSIFYNDPFESEEKLAAELKGQSAYRQVISVNPTLPGWRFNLKDFCNDHPVAGVRIYPGIHGYSLDIPELQELAEFLSENDLPLFISARMEDFRATYLIVPQDIPTEDIKSFISKNPELTVVISTAYPNEMEDLRDVILSSDKVWIDSSYIRGSLFIVEKLYEQGLLDKMLYGSLASMACMESSLQLIESACIPAETMQAIFKHNSEKVFK